ncbi:hypothetical protein I302_102629 [Kwoniella bestiolae CBS 10118]|uniref:Uncharacterized protein n=1 Tax=Kwoniella bestiolae CBS 10118 TaxID=1296100 RepID=A0A1B9GFV0_9TREE|nr:hypothetical protein I302_01318 [Kwoniella bestiolae CBS 10118]OCF29805.1 hypothetical protein I302_01318 [Kwoniella bestiolae CBS 10118]
MPCKCPRGDHRDELGNFGEQPTLTGEVSPSVPCRTDISKLYASSGGNQLCYTCSANLAHALDFVSVPSTSRDDYLVAMLSDLQIKHPKKRIIGSEWASYFRAEGPSYREKARARVTSEGSKQPRSPVATTHELPSKDDRDDDGNGDNKETRVHHSTWNPAQTLREDASSLSGEPGWQTPPLLPFAEGPPRGPLHEDERHGSAMVMETEVPKLELSLLEETQISPDRSWRQDHVSSDTATFPSPSDGASTQQSPFDFSVLEGWESSPGGSGQAPGSFKFPHQPQKPADMTFAPAPLDAGQYTSAQSYQHSPWDLGEEAGIQPYAVTGQLGTGSWARSPNDNQIPLLSGNASNNWREYTGLEILQTSAEESGVWEATTMDLSYHSSRYAHGRGSDSSGRLNYQQGQDELRGDQLDQLAYDNYRGNSYTGDWWSTSPQYGTGQ